MSVSDGTAILGLVFGIVGTVLGVLNYLRDRSDVTVELQWDLEVTPGTAYDHTKKWGVIRVANIGRRPVYVSHAALRVKSDGKESYLVVMDAVNGVRLAEGDPAKVYMVTQEGMEKYAHGWRDVIAQVSDSTGKVWKSRRLKLKDIPSWACKR